MKLSLPLTIAASFIAAGAAFADDYLRTNVAVQNGAVYGYNIDGDKFVSQKDVSRVLAFGADADRVHATPRDILFDPKAMAAFIESTLGKSSVTIVGRKVDELRPGPDGVMGTGDDYTHEYSRVQY